MNELQIYLNKHSERNTGLYLYTYLHETIDHFALRKFITHEAFLIILSKGKRGIMLFSVPAHLNNLL